MPHYSNVIFTTHQMTNNTTTSWFVYIVRCSDDSLYTGVTTDIEKRIFQHNHCNKRGAKYTRVRRPVTLVYNEPANDRSSACQREYQIKQFSKRQKESLVMKNSNETGTDVR